jgi:hypothetical protein
VVLALPLRVVKARDTVVFRAVRSGGKPAVQRRGERTLSLRDLTIEDGRIGATLEIENAGEWDPSAYRFFVERDGARVATLRGRLARHRPLGHLRAELFGRLDGSVDAGTPLDLVVASPVRVETVEVRFVFRKLRIP